MQPRAIVGLRPNKSTLKEHTPMTMMYKAENTMQAIIDAIVHAAANDKDVQHHAKPLIGTLEWESVRKHMWVSPLTNESILKVVGNERIDADLVNDMVASVLCLEDKPDVWLAHPFTYWLRLPTDMRRSFGQPDVDAVLLFSVAKCNAVTWELASVTFLVP